MYLEQQFITLGDGFVRAVVLSKQHVIGLNFTEVVSKMLNKDVSYRPEILPELDLWLQSMEKSSERLRSKDDWFIFKFLFYFYILFIKLEINSWYIYWGQSYAGWQINNLKTRLWILIIRLFSWRIKKIVPLPLVTYVVNVTRKGSLDLFCGGGIKKCLNLILRLCSSVL